MVQHNFLFTWPQFLPYFFFVLFCFETGFPVWPWLAWNSLWLALNSEIHLPQPPEYVCHHCQESWYLFILQTKAWAA